jgi:hypothetical protein
MIATIMALAVFGYAVVILGEEFLTSLSDLASPCVLQY